MRALVVFESMFGDTRAVAERVATGLRTGFDDVQVTQVAEAGTEHVAAADLLVVGGPTHAHGMSRPQTRHAAVTDPAKYGHGAPVEPAADGIGLRDWFSGLPRTGGRAAVFDTRADAPAILTGRASRGIADHLRHGGFGLVDDPQSFLVAKDGGLEPGELERAEQWGRALARTVG